ncbi:hypothetical protein B0T16DRAFT_318941 [Cercophora newfieldiana]|uniref:Uncharacterized protein n=1 Tax=Cercophora newfieldiana TaxID=92897 RepID=A0AA39YSY4_9PEZI|nr:hypothetical protein B0T16DRAFT_318941 [Cercophora newfieldiana]
MSSLDKTSATQAESVEKAPRKRGCVGHCAKFWWAYLLLVIVIVVIVVPVVLLVAVPKIAQGKLDDAQLTIQGIIVSRTESNSLDMAINSTITTDGKVHANIDGFTGVMYLEDLEGHVPFASINFPPTTADALQTVNVSQKLEITNMEALTTFNTWLLTKDEVRITTYGETHVHVKGISRKYPVTFKKTITTPGLRGFDGTTVYDTSISLQPDARGNNFKGLTTIPNRSVFTLEIGNATFNNYLLGKLVGTVFIDNIILYPGMNNTFPMRATIEQAPVLGALSQKPYCDETKGVLPFQISGKSVSNFGQSLTYFADALGSHNQTLDIDVGTPVAKLLGSPVKCAAA